MFVVKLSLKKFKKVHLFVCTNTDYMGKNFSTIGRNVFEFYHGNGLFCSSASFKEIIIVVMVFSSRFLLGGLLKKKQWESPYCSIPLGNWTSPSGKNSFLSTVRSSYWSSSWICKKIELILLITYFAPVFHSIVHTSLQELSSELFSPHNWQNLHPHRQSPCLFLCVFRFFVAWYRTIISADLSLLPLNWTLLGAANFLRSVMNFETGKWW